MSNNYLSSVYHRTRCAGGKRVRLGICSPGSLPVRLGADCPLQPEVTSPSPRWPLHSSLWFWVPVTTYVLLPVISQYILTSLSIVPLLNFSNCPIAECHLFPARTLTDTITHSKEIQLVSDKSESLWFKNPFFFISSDSSK